jgi:hypothetical protein
VSEDLKTSCIDLVRADATYYTASTTPELVQIGPVQVLGLEGRGEPGGTAHLEAIKVLYAVADGVRVLAAGSTTEFRIPPLEGLWWVEDDRPPLEVPREEWRWHLLLRIPETVEVDWVEHARETAGDKAGHAQLIRLSEGLCIQALHRGPYETEPETIARIDALMEEQKLTINGRHHEIYLTPVTEQPPPERIETILRHPVRPVEQ